MPITGALMTLYSIKNMYLELLGVVRPEAMAATSGGDRP